MKHKYEVVVGNIGSVYDGSDESEGRRKYQSYVDLSRSNIGRAGGESVVLMQDGEILKEYEGPASRAEYTFDGEVNY